MKISKKIISDFVLNICAHILPIVLLQLFLLPKTANILGEKEYGLMVTLVALNSMVSLSLGNVLNNVRLLKQNEYSSLENIGDFNIILAALLIINSVIIIVAAGIYTEFNLIQIIFTFITSLFMLLKNYISVWFRIELNYKKVLVDSIIVLIGYFVGYLIFRLTGIWQFIYLCAYTFSCVYILLQKNLLKEPWRKTDKFKNRVSDCTSLSAATVISSSLSYVDKLMLYPMLGGAAVSVYYSATIIGKICSMAVTPISSVMLSYLAKMKEFKKRTFFKMLFGILLLSTAAYFVCVLISKPLLFRLYPKWAQSSLEIIRITTATAMLSLAVSFINPIVMKFCKLNRQIIINLISLVAYLVLGVALLNAYALKGFAFAILITTAVKLLSLVIAFLSDYSKQIQ